jgi:integrative and conjugative element protein (TIGR02256 family)
MTGWVLVANPVVGMFDRQVKKCHGRVEAGGILIGSYRGPHLDVVGFTEPGAQDISEQFRFIRQDARHQHVATQAWRISGRKNTFVGEWHTHPYGDPLPSFIDKRSWRTTVAQTRMTMIFAVVAPGGWRLFWCWGRFGWTFIQPLFPVENGKTGIVFGRASAQGGVIKKESRFGRRGSAL